MPRLTTFTQTKNNPWVAEGHLACQNCRITYVRIHIQTECHSYSNAISKFIYGTASFKMCRDKAAKQHM